jgi:hypothetical protein
MVVISKEYVNGKRKISKQSVSFTKRTGVVPLSVEDVKPPNPVRPRVGTAERMTQSTAGEETTDGIEPGYPLKNTTMELGGGSENEMSEHVLR